MKRANGSGSVYMLKGNRRKPYVAAISKKVNGKRKKIFLGYYETRIEADAALATYNLNPYDVGVTFKDIYKAWSEPRFKTLSYSGKSAYTHSFDRFKPIHDKVFSSLKVKELEDVIADADATPVNKRQMKVLLNQLYKYALKYDIVQTDLSKRFSVEKPKTKLERVPFTDEEIKKLWNDKSDEAKAVLVMIYTGVRVAELYSMEIDTDNWLLKGGVKTEAGKNRIVPIRKKIRSILDFDRDMSQHAFYLRINEFLKSLNHKPHDCRVTFATRYKSADETAVKLILGHAVTDITKGVYTKYTSDELLKVIESVDY